MGNAPNPFRANLGPSRAPLGAHCALIFGMVYPKGFINGPQAQWVPMGHPSWVEFGVKLGPEIGLY